MKIVKVRASENYDVFIERGILKRLNDYLVYKNYNRCLLLMDENVARLYGKALIKSLEEGGKEPVSYIIPSGESSKSFEVLEGLMEFMADNAFTRSDLLIAFGGGVVGDLGGFAAGIFQRGIDYIQIPTTLLSAVDSSVGGKTAINLKAGKNLVGIFKQPKLVICDPDCFLTLDDEDFASGMAEVIKYAILFDDDLFNRLKMPLDKASQDLDDIIKTCLELKARIVLEDELDHGKRQLLNLGHTVGHAIERASNFEIKHGQAVAMGMGIMARACAREGLSSFDTARSIEEILRLHSLEVNSSFSSEELIAYARLDKKIRADRISLVLIRDIGHCEIHLKDFDELENIISLGVMDL